MFCKILFIIFYSTSSNFVYHSISEFFVQVFIVVRKFLIQSLKKFIPVFDKFLDSWIYPGFGMKLYVLFVRLFQRDMIIPIRRHILVKKYQTFNLTMY